MVATIANIVIENGEFIMPEVSMIEQMKFTVALLSFRCTFERPMNSTKFLCLRTNLVRSQPFNPHQIIAFFTVGKNVKHFTFNVPNKQAYSLSEYRMSNADFLICEVGHWEEDYAIESGALQLIISQK